MRANPERQGFSESPDCDFLGVVDAVVAVQRRLVDRADTDEWRVVSQADLAAFAKLALRAVNRTESGGVGLDAMQKALGPKAELLRGFDEAPGGAPEGPLLTAVPDSISAEPLRISFKLAPLDCGVAGGPPQWRWGLRAIVQGSTAYRLFAGDVFSGVPRHA